MKTYMTTILTILFVSLTTSVIFANPWGARKNLSVAPQKIYPEMIKAVKAGNWKKLNTALRVLEPLSEEIDNTLRLKITTELKEAIIKKDKVKAEEKVMEFIVGGIRSLLILSGKEDKHQLRKIMFRQAFIEFLTVEKYLKNLNYIATERIMTNFRGTYNIIRDKSQFITNMMIINRDLKSIVNRP